MATAKYSVHKTPNPKGDGKNLYHVRPVKDRAVRTDRLVTDISDMSSFSSSDVKGMLEAFSVILKRYLIEGSTVELEGIGLFSISLTCPKNIEDPSKVHASHIRFKKVSFKASAKLNEELYSMRFSHNENDAQSIAYSEEERHKRILDFLKSEGSIQSSICMGLNNCNRYIALKDLKKLVATGKIALHGNKSSSIYLLKS